MRLIKSVLVGGVFWTVWGLNVGAFVPKLPVQNPLIFEKTVNRWETGLLQRKNKILLKQKGTQKWLQNILFQWVWSKKEKTQARSSKKGWESWVLESLLKFHFQTLELLSEEGSEIRMYLKELLSLKALWKQDADQKEQVFENFKKKMEAFLSHEQFLSVEEKKDRLRFYDQAFLAQKGKMGFPVFEKKKKYQLKGKRLEFFLSRSLRVQNVFPGVVIYVGPVPGRQQVVIVRHGAHYYSVFGGLKQVVKQVGDWVPKAALIGKVDIREKKLYFEMRDHYHLLNPLQWLKK